MWTRRPPPAQVRTSSRSAGSADRLCVAGWGITAAVRRGPIEHHQRRDEDVERDRPYVVQRRLRRRAARWALRRSRARRSPRARRPRAGAGGDPNAATISSTNRWPIACWASCASTPSLEQRVEREPVLGRIVVEKALGHDLVHEQMQARVDGLAADDDDLLARVDRGRQFGVRKADRAPLGRRVQWDPSAEGRRRARVAARTPARSARGTAAAEGSGIGATAAAGATRCARKAQSTAARPSAVSAHPLRPRASPSAAPMASSSRRTSVIALGTA